MRICIGTITRNRKNGLRDLVNSYCQMQVPANCELVFAVVENDSEQTVAEILEPLKSVGEVHYELEPQHGIPFARNHVLDISLRETCDFTTFVDDDETVTEDWLVTLFGHMQAYNLDLVGGPMKLHDCPPEASALNACIWRGVDRWRRGINNTAIRLIKNGREDEVVICTNNWMVRNAFLERTNIRFDETLGLSGLSDIVFYNAARLVTERTGWVSDAVAYETQPLSRLTPKYQYLRGRDQSIARFYMSYDKVTVKLLFQSIRYVAKMVWLSFKLFVTAPFKQFDTLSLACRYFGMAVGRIKAISGVRSKHYQNVHSV